MISSKNEYQPELNQKVTNLKKVLANKRHQSQ